jgi:hypothetical protein
VISRHLKSRFSQGIFNARIQTAFEQRVDHCREILGRGQMKKGAADVVHGQLEITMAQRDHLDHAFDRVHLVKLDRILEDPKELPFGHGPHFGVTSVRFNDLSSFFFCSNPEKINIAKNLFCV